MRFTKITLAITIGAAAFALTACGGSSSSDASTTIAATTEATVEAAASESSAPASPAGDTEVPDPAVLVKAVDALIDPTITPKERAAAVVGGEDLVATFVKLDDYISQGPPVTFEVVDPTIKDGVVTANVQIINDGTPLEDLYPAFWALNGDTYQITRTGACSLIAVSGITCPDAAAS